MELYEITVMVHRQETRRFYVTSDLSITDAMMKVIEHCNKYNIYKTAISVDHISIAEYLGPVVQ